MYCSHFGLQRLPFNNTPDPTFYYSTPDHEEALATLQYAAQQRKGFVLVTGEIGAGKTLIGRMFLRQIDANATTAVINNTNLTGKQLLAAICTEFGLETPPQASSLELSQRLQAFLLDQFSQNRHVVVLLDEAQNLPDESFEELRMLGNLEADDAKLLQVCILGQPELRARFRKPGMQQLDQRLFRRFHLPALTPEQAASYVAHRLAVAGAAGRELFTPDAIERIVTAAGGVPRIINQICDNALLTAYGQNQSVVDAPIIDLVLERDPVPALGGETHDVASLRDDGADDISAVYGERLADLVQEATHELSTRIAGLSDGKGIVQDQLKAVTVRQKELQRIVSGATTRWLAAKEKLEAYRHEIHDVIRDLTRRCQATQKQMDELARSAAPTEDLKEIREMHRRETARLLQAIREQRAEFQKRIEDAEAGWNETQSRLQQLSTTQVTRDLLAAARAEQEQRVQSIVQQIDAHRDQLVSLMTSLRQQCDATQADLETLRASTTEAARRTEHSLHRITARCEQHESMVRTLREELAALDGRLSGAMQKVAGHGDVGDVDALRAETHEALAEVHRRLEQEAETVRKLRTAATRLVGSAAGRHQVAFDALAGRIDRQEAHLRELSSAVSGIEGRLRERFEAWGVQFATRQQVESLDQATQRTAQQLNDLTEQTIARSRELEALSRQVADETQDVRRRAETQAAQIEELGRQVAGQREGMREQARLLVRRIEQVQKELESVREAAANSAPLDQLREEQAQIARDLLERVSEQQTRFDALAETIGRRCDLMAERLDHREDVEHLERSLADHERQLAEIRQSVETSTVEFGYAVARIEQHCDRTSVALESLSAQSASREDLRNLQTLHDQAIAGLRERIDGTSAAHEHELASLNARWQTLADSITSLKANSTPPAELARVEQQLTTGLNQLQERCEHLRESLEDVAAHENTLERELSSVREQLEETDARAETDIRSIIERVDALAARLSALEDKAQQPYQLQLSPEIMTTLGEQVRAAHGESEQLGAAIERAGAISAHLRNSSSQIQEIMEHWTATADTVRQQSEELTTSTRTAAQILAAMKKVHAAINAKLNSQQWQNELQRGEALATRMESATNAARTVVSQLHAALNDFENCRSDVDGWSRRQSRGEELAARLSRLLREAQTVGQRFDRSLEARKQLLAGIARNASSLAQVIAAARLDDETINPTPAAVTEDAEDAKPPVPAAVRYVPDPARVRHAEPQRSGVARIHPQRLGV